MQILKIFLIIICISFALSIFQFEDAVYSSEFEDTDGQFVKTIGQNDVIIA